jgi:hypothetical protein
VTLPLLLAAALLSQAAPVGAPVVSARVVSGGSTVFVQGSEQDDGVREQVVRVLPGAMEAASRFGPLPPVIVLTVHATHAGLESATGRTGIPWMRAWARVAAVDLQSPRSWSRGRASDRALGQIIAHELTHCVLFDATGRDGRSRTIPHWFTEGMASVAAGEHHDVANVRGLVGPGPDPRASPDVAYATADRAFRELLRVAGEEAIRRILGSLREGRAFHAAFDDAVGTSLARFEGDLGGRLPMLALSR